MKIPYQFEPDELAYVIFALLDYESDHDVPPLRRATRMKLAVNLEAFKRVEDKFERDLRLQAEALDRDDIASHEQGS